MPAAPRERVSHRRKIALACEPCRERKSRCDGGKPICASCRRRSFTLEQCIYKADNARTESNDTYIRALHQRIRELEQACHNAGVDVPSLTTLPDARATPGESDVPGTAAVLPSGGHPDPAANPNASQNTTPPVPSVSSNGHRPPSEVTSAVAASRADDLASSAVETPYSLSERTPTCASRNALESMHPESQVSAMGAIAAADADLDMGTTPEYFGRSSAVSFMQQTFLKPNSVPHSGISRSLSSAAFQPAAYPRSSLQHHLRNLVLPPRSLADHLLETFWDRVYCLYPFFHRQSFERQYERLWVPSSAPTDDWPSGAVVGLGGSPETPANLMVFHCALNSIFALSCHFSNLAPADMEPVAYSFFLRSKALIGLDFLEVNTIGVVQAFLLTALYLQSTPFPSRCWNAIGVACRVAQGLGLHTDMGDSARDVLGRDIRRRTWHGCVHMDITVSMMLGRPPATLPSSLPHPSVLEDEQMCQGTSSDLGHEPPSWKWFYVETIKLNEICAAILSEVYQPWLTTDCVASPTSGQNKKYAAIDVLVKLDSNLAEFESGVPYFLSWKKNGGAQSSSSTTSPMFQRQTNVLQARLLHLKMMLHRPVLTLLCNDGHDHTSSTTVRLGPLHSKILAQCALSCISAAMDLLELIHDNYKTSVTGAWWFNGLYTSTAGIVLIMAHSCPQVIGSINKTRLEQCWEQCVEILQHLSTFNPPSKNQLNLLQKSHQQHVLNQPGLGSTNRPQDGAREQQSAANPDADRSWNQTAPNAGVFGGMGWETQGYDNLFLDRDLTSDFTGEAFGFFDSLNFFEGGLANYI